MTTPVWETIAQVSKDDLTQRMPVPGGWLVCRVNGYHSPHYMVSWFIEDADHTWDISE